MIWVVAVAVLFAKFGSKFGELAVAVLIIEVLFVAPPIFTVIVKVTVAPLAIFPGLQVTVPTAPIAGVVQATPPEFRETNPEFAGTGSFITTAAARYGPRFFTVTV